MLRRDIIDLTHSIHARMPASVGFPRTTVMRHLDQKAGDVATVEIIQMSLHSGTHVDAPFHFIQGAETVDALHPLALCGSALIVDVAPTESWRGIADTELTQWEVRAGNRINPGDILILRSGHGRYWRPIPEGDAYMTQPWPYLSSSAIDLLLERGIRALGVECPDPDKVDQRDLASASFEAHKRLLGAGVPIIENLANLDKVPRARFELLALALPVRGASGSPIRAIALLP